MRRVRTLEMAIELDNIHDTIRQDDRSRWLTSAQSQFRPIGQVGAQYIWDKISIDFAASVNNAIFNIPMEIKPDPKKTFMAIEKPISDSRRIKISYNFTRPQGSDQGNATPAGHTSRRWTYSAGGHRRRTPRGIRGTSPGV